jgi:uncharacterized protein YecE (DUF72 family)
MAIVAGTSGYAYKEWKGSFYPEDLPQSEMLAHYATRLPTVEINNTFYRMPTEKLLGGWADQVPASFSFVLKAPRRITHIKRLAGVQEEVDFFVRIASATLGPRLGPLLFQLPPNLKKDVERLRAFLGILPPRLRAALEFRNESWFTDDVYEALREHGAALVVADTDEAATPLVATAAWGYMRLRGTSYGEADLERWLETIAAQGWSDCWVFFKHEDEGTGPPLALRLLELARAVESR